MQRALAVASLLLACSAEKKSASVERSRADTSSADVWQMDAESIELGFNANNAPAPGAGGSGSASTPPALQQDNYGPPKGPLDKAAIKREVSNQLGRISACYEKRLAEQPRLTGETRVDFVIAQDGHVASATGSGFDRDIDACCAGVIKSIVFPPPSAGTVAVSYPFRFVARGPS